MLNNLAFWLTFLSLTGFWGLGALAAWGLDMLTTRQMLAFGIPKGIAYLAHLGMTNDLVNVHPLCAYLVGLFWAQWYGSSWLLLAIPFGIATGWAGNYQWTRQKGYIESQNKIVWDYDEVNHVHVARSAGKMSVVSMIHVPHMAVIMTIVFMFAVWVFRGLVPWNLAAGGTCLLLAHVCAGQHPFLKVFSPPHNPFEHEKSDYFAAVLYVVFNLVAYSFLLRYAFSLFT